MIAAAYIVSLHISIAARTPRRQYLEMMSAIPLGYDPNTNKVLGRFDSSGHVFLCEALAVHSQPVSSTSTVEDHYEQNSFSHH
jgi:hypothetical protein